MAFAVFGAVLPAQAAPQPMLLLENHLPQSDADRINVETLILQRLSQSAAPELQIQPVQLSTLRAWQMLKQPGNYCALSKIKTKEREKLLYFARLPTTIYPPLQLIGTRTFGKTPLDLARLLQQQSELKIGVIKGRSYGAELDKLIAHHPKQFFQRSGAEAAQNLALMLSKGRLDALLEFSAITTRSLQHLPEAPKLYPHQLTGQPLVRGYLACNKSELGLQMVQWIDQKMADAAYQTDVLKLHQQFFSADDFALLQPELLKVFPQAMSQTD
ncbi:hypothetical protein [Rheinheimera sp.]|uniref:hypothetical protein n=1 Tax=Rheinheimera sp. TaxID=1869214 RepID=UPI003AF4F365